MILHLCEVPVFKYKLHSQTGVDFVRKLGRAQFSKTHTIEKAVHWAFWYTLTVCMFGPKMW